MPVNKEESKIKDETKIKGKEQESSGESETGSEETGSTTGSEESGSSSEEGSSTASSSSGASDSKEKKPMVKKNISGGRGGREQRQPAERDKELDSLTIEMRNGKRLFVDAKENRRGKFIRVAEALGRMGGRSYGGNRPGGRIIMRLKVAKELVDRLDEFTDAAQEIIENAEKREETKPRPELKAGERMRPLHSAVILDEGRRYFVDLLPSRFKGREPMMRLTMNNPISGLRNSVTVESGEAPYIKKAIGSMVEKFYDEKEEQEDKDQVELAPHSVRFGRRIFFFDPGRQPRGKFVRITEVCMRDGQALRSSLMLPDKVLAEFSQILSDYDEKMNTDAKEAKCETSSASGDEDSQGEKEVGSDKKVKVDDA